MVLSFFIIGGRNPVAELDRFQIMLVRVLIVVAYLPIAYLGIRRLHDFGRSGWWYVTVHLVTLLFALLLPAAYAWYLTTGLSVVLLFTPGTKGAKRYGVRRVAKLRAEDSIPTSDGCQAFSSKGDPDDKSPS